MIPLDLLSAAVDAARRLHNPPRVSDVRLALVANGCLREPPLTEVVEELRHHGVETASERCVACGQRVSDA